MNTLRLIASGVFAFGLIVGVRAAEKADGTKEKLVGSWEVVKAESGAPAVGTVVVFGNDGKIKIIAKSDGKEMTVEGTYTLDGQNIKVTLKRGDAVVAHTVTIKKLTDTELIGQNDQGKTSEFKKK